MFFGVFFGGELIVDIERLVMRELFINSLLQKVSVIVF